LEGGFQKGQWESEGAALLPKTDSTLLVNTAIREKKKGSGLPKKHKKRDRRNVQGGTAMQNLADGGTKQEERIIRVSFTKNLPWGKWSTPPTLP